MNERYAKSWGIALVLTMLSLAASAADTDRFLEPKAWQCTFGAIQEQQDKGTTGPGGMADDGMRQLFQALGSTGLKAENPGGDTDSYVQSMNQTVRGEVRLHYVYDGGPDGIQLAGWNNGGADVSLESTFEGTEQNETIIRSRATSYNGPAVLEGDEYSPAFQIWIYPEDGVYALEYALSPVTATRVERCRMAEGMEDGRRQAEGATDADMPLGGFVSGLTKATCATESTTEVDMDGGAMSGLVENVSLPAFGLVIEGEGESAYVNSGNVLMRWSCRPE